MIARRKIRTQMYIGFGLLLVFVAMLSWTSFQGARKFRLLAKNIRERSMELPLAAKLSIEVNTLRATLSQCVTTQQPRNELARAMDNLSARYEFRSLNLPSVETALQNYIEQLQNGNTSDPRIADISHELSLVGQFQASLNSVKGLVNEPDWDLGGNHFNNRLENEVEALQTLSSNLPAVLKQRMEEFAEQSRAEYQRAMYFSGFITLCGCLSLFYLGWSFSRSVFIPLEQVISGAREVATGNYEFIVETQTEGEVKELADTLNKMTANFLAIRQDLNRQVQLQTKQVVRSEQMASVGFLAAGVAHEINNPLATIAWSAESLETRLLEILKPTCERTVAEQDAEIASMKKYLRRIQDEAFRCKGITSSLLDFSRLGDTKKSPVHLAPIVDSVIEMVKPLGRYRHRNVEFRSDPRLKVVVNSQEIKQVILNLVTNSLDATDDGGHVWVSLEKQGSNAVLMVRDDGCGMSEEVRKHLFEPFFTRRRDGQGTGLGLSISYRIIEEHHGQIEVASDGPGTGSQFTVSIPLHTHEQNEQPARAAA